MSGYASIDTPALTLARNAAIVGVYRYQPSSSAAYQVLPNVRVISISNREGPDPGFARFRYVFSPADPSTDPTNFEEAMSIGTNLINVVQNDDRLVVMVANPDGSTQPIFDGFAQVPELSFSSSQELVTFIAYGVAVREWDLPLGGALMRDADDPMTVDDVETDLDAVFNPSGLPNATPQGADATDAFGNTYATLIDPNVVRDPDVRRFWTLPMAARYVCYRGNSAELYVLNPAGPLLDALLDSRSPIAGVTMDPSDPATYTSEPIIVSDFLSTGKPWPVALDQLLQSNGFGMVFRLETDSGGNPITRLDVFRRQDATTSSLKDLYLQQSGQPLDPGQTNLGQARLVRDTANVANAFTVISRPVRYEATFVLAPGFSISSNDGASSSSISQFNRGDPSFSLTNHDKYRLYILDETGEGHWNFSAAALNQTATDLSGLLAGTTKNPLPYVKRRRIPLGDLFSTDPNLKPLKARLSISTNYQGPSPGTWDGTGTWQTVVGGFNLLSDRLGIWINVPNPNGWNIGIPTVQGLPYPAGVVRGVEDQSNPSATHFYLRLTCVIEGDGAINGIADQRPSSSTFFPITRFVDASERYFKDVIAPESEFNSSPDQVIVRDDTEDATSEAEARRLAHEAGEVSGSAGIPRLTLAYRIGDKIRSIVGRNLSLQCNAGAPLEEGQVFPSVVGLSWEFESRQTTTLQLSDHRGELR